MTPVDPARLRQIADEIEESAETCEVPSEAKVCREAAAEIERLRSAPPALEWKPISEYPCFIWEKDIRSDVWGPLVLLKLAPPITTFCVAHMEAGNFLVQDHDNRPSFSDIEHEDWPVEFALLPGISDSDNQMVPLCKCDTTLGKLRAAD